MGMNKTYLSNLNVSLIIGDFIVCDEQWKMSTYTPNHNKLYYICEGHGWVKIGDRDYYPKKNDFVFVPAGVEHAFSYIGDNFYQKYWCHFTAKIGEKDLNDLFDMPYVVHIENDTFIKALFEKLVCYNHSENINDVFNGKGVLLQLIAAYLEVSKSKEKEVYHSEAMNDISQLLTYIDEHLGDALNIDQLSSILHLQKNYFIKFFKMHLGITPMQYVKQRRLEEAKRRLINTTCSISTIATDLGFSGVSHFSYQFHQYANMAPSQFRKQYLNQ